MAIIGGAVNQTAVNAIVAQGPAALLEATCSASPSIAAQITTDIALSASLLATVTCTSELQSATHDLTTTAQAVPSVSAVLATAINLEAALVAACSIGADLQVQMLFSATSSATISVSADLSTEILLSAQMNANTGVIAMCQFNPFEWMTDRTTCRQRNLSISVWTPA